MIGQSFSCYHSPKKFKLSFDGGLLGQYCLEICSSCYVDQNKKFLIKEEKIGARK